MASITINEGSGVDLKELLEVNRQILASLESSRQILLGIAAVLVRNADGLEEEPAVQSASRPIGPSIVPPRPPVPAPVYVEPEEEPELAPAPEGSRVLVYSEDYATNEEAGVLTQTEEQREKIDMEAQLRDMGIEIDDSSIPFPLPSENQVGEV